MELEESGTAVYIALALVESPRTNKPSREFDQFFEVLGLMEAETEEEMGQQIEERKANTPRGRANREALVAAIELKDYEFNAHGVDLGNLRVSRDRSGWI